MKSMIVLLILLAISLSAFTSVSREKKKISEYLLKEDDDFTRNSDEYVDSEDELDEETFLDGYGDESEDTIGFHQKNDPWLWKRVFNSRRRCRHVKRPACFSKSNGCGPKLTQSKLGKLNYPFKRLFTSSCNKHDNCYDCHTERGWGRKSCDYRFLYDLLGKCNCRYNQSSQKLLRIACEIQARLMFRAVRLGGSFFITKENNAYCYNECIKYIGSPYKVVDQ